jgi:4-aminobutyrate aminotransferase
VEAAVKLARKHTGRQGVITFRGAFHGRTMGSVSYTTSNAKYRDGYHPVLGSTWVVPFPHPYRWGMTEDEALDYSLNELESAVQARGHPEEHRGDAGRAGPGRGWATTRRLPASWRSCETCDEHGIMLIFDEVQTGFGRTAEWFAADHYGVNPDIIALGKGIANGFPLSAYGAPRR